MAEANIPENLLYTEEHEYVLREGEDQVVVGITDYAQGELSDIVFVELPDVGNAYAKTEPFGTIEAVKAVSELYTPVGGEIVAVNVEPSEPSAMRSSVSGSLGSRFPAPSASMQKSIRSPEATAVLTE